MLGHLWFVAILLLLDRGAALDQDVVDLKWKFEKGKPFYQEFTTETTRQVNLTGEKLPDLPDLFKHTYYLSWTPERYNELEKTWVIRLKIDGIKVESDSSGKRIRFDSTKDMRNPDPGLGAVPSFVGAQFKVMVRPNRTDARIERGDELIKKLRDHDTQTSELLKLFLDDDTLREWADPGHATLPNRPVRKGDSWDRNINTMISSVGGWQGASKYTFEDAQEKNNDLVRISVKTSMKYMPPPKKLAGTQPFKTVDAQIQAKDANGSLLFDIRKGRVASSRATLKLEGTFKIEIDGMVSEVKFSEMQTTTTRTSDENPIAKATGK
jgi:hypothetical protein